MLVFPVNMNEKTNSNRKKSNGQRPARQAAIRQLLKLANPRQATIRTRVPFSSTSSTSFASSASSASSASRPSPAAFSAANVSQNDSTHADERKRTQPTENNQSPHARRVTTLRSSARQKSAHFRPQNKPSFPPNLILQTRPTLPPKEGIPGNANLPIGGLPPSIHGNRITAKEVLGPRGHRENIAAQSLCSARNFSASMAAMQPEPAAVMAWR